jgi:hypothetical protein
LAILKKYNVPLSEQSAGGKKRREKASFLSGFDVT